MRKGAQRCPIRPGTRAQSIYGDDVNERHRHRYEVNNVYVPRLEDAGMVISARTPTENLPEMMELPSHPCSWACSSTPSSLRRRATGTPCSPAISGRRSSTKRSAPRRRDESLRFRYRPGSSLFPDRRPVRHRVARAGLETAGRLKEITGKLGVPFIYKSSFDKANRSSGKSFRGPGMDEGLKILADVRAQLDVPVLTDVHDIDQVAPVAAVVDMLQTPAFLCRQTDFIRACAATLKPVNIKKGQFLAPHDMLQVARKARDAALEAGGDGNNILVCERGASFGYNNLVSDMRSLAIMRETDCPVVFDATHSVQLPGGQGASSGGQREFVPVLARAAVAVGVAGLFMETHPNPACAMSDGPNAVPLDRMAELLESLVALDRVTKRSGFLENQFV